MKRRKLSLSTNTSNELFIKELVLKICQHVDYKDKYLAVSKTLDKTRQLILNNKCNTLCDDCNQIIPFWDFETAHLMCYHCGAYTSCFTWYKEVHRLEGTPYGKHCNTCDMYSCIDCSTNCADCGLYICNGCPHSDTC